MGKVIEKGGDMKEELLRLVRPMAESFVDSLLQEWDKVGNAQSKVDEEYKKIGDERRSIKEQENENNNLLKIRQDKLDNGIAKYNKLNKELSDEFSRQTDITNKMNLDAAKTEQLRKTLEEEQGLSSEEFIKQRRKSQEWQTKTDLLQVDTEKLKAEWDALHEEQRKVNIVKQANSRKENNLADREQKVAEREVDCKIRENKVAFEYKRLKLYWLIYQENLYKM